MFFTIQFCNVLHMSQSCAWHGTLASARQRQITNCKLRIITGYETDSVFEFIPCQDKIKPWGSAMYFYIALSTWLPLLFIFIGNLLLIIRMRKSYKIHNELTRESSSQ